MKDPINGIPASHAAYEFYLKLTLAQHRVRLDGSCPALPTFCEFARRRSLTPMKGALLILSKAHADENGQFAPADICKAVRAALSALRREL